MGKASGVSRRRKKKFNYNRNVKKLHKKLLSLPKIKCGQLEKAWDSKKSYLRNMIEIGLSSDPNKTVGKKKKKKAEKMEVIPALEAEAYAPQPKTLKLPTEPMKFCVYMIEKYEDNYIAMAKDPKNYYQDTPAQIKNKIKKFQRIPMQWNAYLRAKGLLNTKVHKDEYDFNINEIMGEQMETSEA